MAMMSFVSKLLLSGQLSFEPGKFTIFGHRVMIFPADLLLVVNKRCEKDVAFRKQLYEAMKEAVYAFSVDINKREHIRDRDMAAFLINLTEMNGYGRLKIPKLDMEKKVAIFQMAGLPSEQQVGKIRHSPIDYYWAGMLAGGSAFVFKDPKVECVETSCVISGRPVCEFVAARPEDLKKLTKKALFS
jgi:predicted hydrocarbon binding protein